MRFIAAPLFILVVFSTAASDNTSRLLEQLSGKKPSSNCIKGFELLDQGQLDGSQTAFAKAASKNPDEIAALFGLYLHALLNNEFQKGEELLCKALSVPNSPAWTELLINEAFPLLPLCEDAAAFTTVAERVIHDDAANPRTKDLIRRAYGAWLKYRGQYSAAAEVYKPLQYIGNWAFIGPFENRDRSGFTSPGIPEAEVDLDKPLPGRNRNVNWFQFQSHSLDGSITLSDVFEPKTHVLAYAVSFVKSEAPVTVTLHAGCAGALAVWVNDKPAGNIGEYHDFGGDKILANVSLRAGWNKILVKSAVVEETEWAFSVRLSTLRGGAQPGLTFDSSADALKGFLADKAAVTAPSSLTAAPDVLDVLKTFAGKHPETALTQYFLASISNHRHLGDKEDDEAVKAVKKAVAQAPKNVLYRLQLAMVSDDSNEARQAAETAAAMAPALPLCNEVQADLANRGKLQIAAEEFARKTWELGAAKCGRSALVLCDALGEGERGAQSTIPASTGRRRRSSFNESRGQRAEAWRIARDFTMHHPYLAQGWLKLVELEDSQAAKQTWTEKGLSFCGGDRELRRLRADQLFMQGKEAEAAALVSAGLAGHPFDAQALLSCVRYYQRAGEFTRATALLENARAWAVQNPDVMQALALERRRAGKTQEAAELLKSILKVKPNSPKTKDYLAIIDKGDKNDKQFFAQYDIQLKDLKIPTAEEFPKENAITLLNQEVVKVNPNGSTSRMIHTIAKILRPPGINEVRRHTIYYEPQRQVVDILRAAVITPDFRELSRVTINDRSTSAAQGAQTLIYDEHHMKSVSFNDLEAGSIIDLQYTIRDNGDNIYGDYFADTFHFGDWSGHPVQKAQYVMDHPKSLAINTRTFNSDVKLEHVPNPDANREVMRWEMDNIPGIERESRMPPVVDKIPQLQATTMESWEKVGEWYWHLAKEQLAVNDQMRELIKDLTKDSKTQTEKLRAIHDWVIPKIRYLGIEFGRNGYKPHKATETYKALYGDCKDTATLITAMLKEVGIDSRLVLIRTTDAGEVPPNSLPMPNLFNHCIAYIPNVDGKDYWIDGTTDFNRLGEVPWTDCTANVLVVEPNGGKFKKIPMSNAQDNLISMNYRARISKNGSAILNTRDVRAGQFAGMMRGQIETSGRFEQMMKEYTANRFKGAEVTKFETVKPSDQGPAWTEMTVKVPVLGSTSGEKIVLPTVFDPLDMSRRYASESQRKFDLEMAHPWTRRSEITYELEAGMKVVSCPEPASIDTGFCKYTRSVNQSNNTVTIVDEFQLTQKRIAAKDYPAFKDFCNKMDSLADQKVMIETH